MKEVDLIGISIQKKRSKVFEMFLLSFFLVLVITPVVYPQIVGQVIDLGERARDFFVEATKGNIRGQATVNIFGQNLVVGTSTEDVQSQGGTLTFLQSAELITFASSDGADTLAGANARSIEVVGLDENFIEISEIVNLSGVTEVNTTNEFIRINRIEVDQVGTYTVSNAGTITGTAALSGTVQIEISIGGGQSKTTHFTVPAGENAIITTIQITMDTGKAINAQLMIRENADDVTVPVSPTKTLRDWRGLDTPFQTIDKANLLLEERTDVWFEAITTAGAGSEVEVNYDMVQYAVGT